MNIFKRIGDLLRGTPSRRNKPGGYAWINAAVDCGCGEHVLIGRVVRTVKLTEFGLWAVEPPQVYTCTHLTTFVNGGLARSGDVVTALAFSDECLTPIPGDCVKQEDVEELYLTGATRREKEPA